MVGPVGDENVGAGAGEGEEGFAGHGVEVSPAAFGGGVEHGIFAADVVGGEGEVGVGAELGENVEVEEGGFEHEDVGAFGFVELGFAEGGAGVAGGGLVGFAVTAAGGGFFGVAEGAVEGGGELGGVGHDEGLVKMLLVEGGAQGSDLAVHHGGGGHDVGAGLSVGEGDAGEVVEGGVVVDLTGGVEGAAVAVVGVGADADVADDGEVGEIFFDSGDGLLNGAVGVVGGVAVGIFFVGFGEAEEEDAAESGLNEGVEVVEELVDGEAGLAGHGVDGLPLVCAGDDEGGPDEFFGAGHGGFEHAADAGGLS